MQRFYSISRKDWTMKSFNSLSEIENKDDNENEN